MAALNWRRPARTMVAQWTRPLLPGYRPSHQGGCLYSERRRLRAWQAPGVVREEVAACEYWLPLRPGARPQTLRGGAVRRRDGRAGAKAHRQCYGPAELRRLSAAARAGGRQMTDRLRQIESLFQEALQRDPAERDAWLREAFLGG